MIKNLKDFIKQMFSIQQKAKDREVQSDQLTAEESNELKQKQKIIFEKLAIKEFFESIIADGSIRLSDECAAVDVFKKTRYNNEYYDIGYQIISKYTPAAIVNTDMSISLLYDYQPIYRLHNNHTVCLDYHKEIRFIINNNSISLVYQDLEYVDTELPDNEHYSYVLLNDNLEELIDCGFRHPILIAGRGYEGLSKLYVKELSILQWLNIIFWK